MRNATFRSTCNSAKLPLAVVGGMYLRIDSGAALTYLEVGVLYVYLYLYTYILLQSTCTSMHMQTTIADIQYIKMDKEKIAKLQAQIRIGTCYSG